MLDLQGQSRRSFISASVGESRVLLALDRLWSSVTRNPRFPYVCHRLLTTSSRPFSGLEFVFGLALGGVALGTVLACLVGVLILWRELISSTNPLELGLRRRAFAPVSAGC